MSAPWPRRLADGIALGLGLWLAAVAVPALVSPTLRPFYVLLTLAVMAWGAVILWRDSR
jgi:hypothetical protein